MGEPYIGEIRMFAGNFAPAGWMFCEGQLLPISENDALFTLIGTTYGGDGESTFALPDLRGRLPMHMGNGFILGETGGVEEVTLTTNQIPIHNHPLLCAASGGTPNSNPQGGYWGPSDQTQYSTGTGTVQMGNPAITAGPSGGSQPHTNFMPYLCIDFIISLFGIFPPPN
jgi:microcystin-dependent protein